MPFRIVRGTFPILGTGPDGDSVRFKADDPALLDGVDGRPVAWKADGRVQLRLENIDALETRFPTIRGKLPRPPPFAEKARTLLLDYLGHTRVSPDDRGRVAAATDAPTGYTLTREVERDRRPVSLLFPGDPPAADGSDVRLDPDGPEGS